MWRGYVARTLQNAIIISKLPIIQTGLKGVMQAQFADYELTYCRSVEELTLLLAAVC
jgi:hypothetical protein